MLESAVMPHRPDPVPGEELKTPEVAVIPPKSNDRPTTRSEEKRSEQDSTGSSAPQVSQSKDKGEKV